MTESFSPPFLNAGFEWSFTCPGFGPEVASPAGAFGGGMGGGGEGVFAVDEVSAGFDGGGAVFGAGASVLLHPAANISAPAHVTAIYKKRFITLLHVMRQRAHDD